MLKIYLILIWVNVTLSTSEKSESANRATKGNCVDFVVDLAAAVLEFAFTLAQRKWERLAVALSRRFAVLVLA